jgi:hypothetical protein
MLQRALRVANAGTACATSACATCTRRAGEQPVPAPIPNRPPPRAACRRDLFLKSWRQVVVSSFTLSRASRLPADQARRALSSTRARAARARCRSRAARGCS